MEVLVLSYLSYLQLVQTQTAPISCWLVRFTECFICLVSARLPKDLHVSLTRRRQSIATMRRWSLMNTSGH